MQKSILWIVTAAFAALTMLAVRDHGLLGIFMHQLGNTAGWQVLIDLVIALGLFLIWMWNDARRLGRNPWPWLLATLVAGSFGPLVYLLTRKENV